jgi:hypothetical protein
MWVWVRMPFYHPRMRGYDIEYLPVETDEQWAMATEGREWDLVTWVERTSIFLAAKLLTGDPELEAQVGSLANVVRDTYSHPLAGSMPPGLRF